MTAATKPPKMPRPEPELDDPEPFRPTPQQQEDYRWINSDPDIVKKYAGQFVVPYRGKVIGHGEPVEASAQARQYLASIGVADEVLMVIEITDFDNFPI